MRRTRHIQTALSTAALLLVGVACATTASSAPAGTTPPADPVEATPETGWPETETVQPADTEENDTKEDPTPSTTPEAPPEPEPGWALPDGLADDDGTPDPDPGPDPDPQELAAPTEPDPDPDPGPAVDDALVATLPVCGLYPPIPDDAANVTTVFVDGAGDGSADDTVTSYLAVGDGQWRIRLATNGGSVSEVTVSGVGPGAVEVLGAVHVDTDDPEQILAVVGSGGSALRLGVFGADGDGCLFRFGEHGTGDVIEYHVGETIGSMTGLHCYDEGGFRYLSSTTAISNGPGSGTWNIYGTDTPRESEQTLQSVGGVHLIGVPDGHADLAAVPTIHCPGISA